MPPYLDVNHSDQNAATDGHAGQNAATDGQAGQNAATDGHCGQSGQDELALLVPGFSPIRRKDTDCGVVCGIAMVLR